MTALVAVAPGPMVTVQDHGRFGRLGEGVPESGPMDVEAFWLANALVGNDLNEGLLEFGLFAGRFKATGPCRMVVTGGDFTVEARGRRQAVNESFDLEAGDEMAVGPAPDATFGYIAVAGGFALEPLMGSVATHVRYRIGPIPRALQAGDGLPCRRTAAPTRPRLRALGRRMRPQARAIRVVLGPQSDRFTREALDAFLLGEFKVTAKADRMGFRLAGPPLPHVSGADIVSDGIVAGSIQVPGDQQPIVLLADRQTTGGYPKIATVVTADLHRVAQRRTGQIVRFIALSPDDARRSYLRFRQDVAYRLSQLAPLPGT